jgi:hypothetical protein
LNYFQGRFYYYRGLLGVFLPVNERTVWLLADELFCGEALIETW